MKRVSSVAKEKNAKAEAAKTVAKKVVAKVEPVKTEEFKQEKLVETEKVEAAVEKKEEKKPVAKKTAEKKAVAVQEEVFVQYGEQEIFTANVVDRVKAAYVAEGHAADSIEKIRVYIKPFENMVYYVVNDDYASGISLF